MDFDKIKEKILNLKKNKKIIALGILILLAFVYKTVFLPEVNKIKKVRQNKLIWKDKLSKKMSEFYSVEKLFKNPAQYKEELKVAEEVLISLEEKIASLNEKLVKKDMLSGILNVLTDFPAAEDIEYNLIKMEPLADKGNFSELPITVKLTCDFITFLEYIKYLEALPLLIDFRKLEIESVSDEGVVKVDSKIYIYVSNK